MKKRYRIRKIKRLTKKRLQSLWKVTLLILKILFFPYAWKFYLIAFAALCCSLYFETTTGQSFFAINYPEIHCPSYLQAPILFEVVKILGLSNVLVASIYASLNKTILGLSYSEIISKKYASYHWCSASHVILTVACIICAAAGFSESTLICIIAIAYGFIYQWIVLYTLILKADKAKKKAFKIWRKTAKKGKDIKKALLRLAGTVPSRESKYYFSHLESIATLLVAYIEKTKQAGVGNISEIWSTMCEHLPKEQQLLLARDFFETICTLKKPRKLRDERKETVSLIANAYVLHKIISLKYIVDRTLDDSFLDLAYEISQLAYTLPLNTPLNIKHCSDSRVLSRRVADSMRTLFPIITHIHYFIYNFKSTDFLEDMYSPTGTTKYVYDIAHYLFPKLSTAQQLELDQLIGVVIDDFKSKHKGDNTYD